ncbi:TonB-dependent receptor [Porticoccus sp. W117]|uniref:TonB-dependent receptor n=1 Tax=Porticoccus sp. W117 TaxID=3054777 RepID=UPI00259A389A|nr:TonB-dependent receptor [Porticoccus sp. W117]MDM3872273.1 TonB-dependent receptor [Porticoccus sp. W117]
MQFWLTFLCNGCGFLTLRNRWHHCVRYLSAVCLLLSACAHAASHSDGQKLYEIDIPELNAAEALNIFAEQTDIVLLFPYEKAKQCQANKVRGRFTLGQGLDVLLKGSGLKGNLSENGTVTISLATQNQTVEGRKEMPKKKKLSLGVLAAISSLFAVSANAEEDKSEDSGIDEEIVAVGSQIKGANIEGALPVTVLGQEDITLTGASTGDELLRSIPQIGEVAFSSERSVGGVNDARGDVGSINLRGLGTGNTLTLLNGRRLVLHPGTQTENFVPVTTVNSNTLPVRGLQRVEVLRDGAAAIYGTDAVAGVINYLLDDDYDGSQLSVRYGTSQGTGLNEVSLNGITGLEFNDGRTKVTLSGSYFDRKGLQASERPYSASSDLRPLLEGTGSPFEGDTDFRGTSTDSPFGEFQAPIDVDIVGPDGVNRSLTTSSRRFHTQPLGNSGCIAGTEGFNPENPGVCLDNGILSTTSSDENLRSDRNRVRSLTSDVERLNIFAFVNHEFESGHEFFGEASYYQAETLRIREQAGVLGSQEFDINANAYWNPLGPTTLADGVTPNPNRLAGIDAPAEGLGLRVRDFRAIDTGLRNIEVENDSYRLLGGIRGSRGDWDWESAIVYSEFEVEDVAKNRISLTLLRDQINLTTPDAYNPFLGGDLSDPSNPINPGSNVNSQAALDAIRIDVTRKSRTTLALWDYKLSNASLFSLPAGDVGLATGVEVRRETYRDDRDDRLDGTITFERTEGDASTEIGTDVVGSSGTPDSSGDRRVISAYAEFLVPILADLPLIQRLDAQIAVRYEDFDDVGSTTKPKFALSWQLVDWFKIRTAYSEGFRAPNIPQIVEQGVSRVNTRTDVVRDERQGTEEVRSGSTSLQPEDDENIAVGFVFTPLNDLTFTLDWWKIEQEGVVGILGGQNQLLFDSLLRAQGSFNPNVIRQPDEADGTPGEVIRVLDSYSNLSPRSIEGADVSLEYSLDTDLGDFTFKLNAARLIEFTQEPDAISAQLLAAQESGLISPVTGEAAVPVTLNVGNAGDLRRENGRPDWRGSVSLRWRKDEWGAGIFTSYVDDVVDTSATLSDGTLFPVGSFLRTNVNLDYRFQDGALDGTRVRLGVRNIADREPPLADNAFGYFSSLHSNRGRYLYLDLSKRFN